MKDAGQIKDMLNQRAEAVCSFLLPAGHRRGHQWTVGDIRNTPPKSKAQGGSLNIELDGGKVGVWADFADVGMRGGNLLDLWMKARQVDFKTALHEARDFLGIREDHGLQRPSQSVRKSTPPAPKATSDAWALQFTPVNEGSVVWKWLTEKRGLQPQTIRAYQVGEKEVRQKEGPARQCVVFPSYNPQGELVRVKFRDIAEKAYMPTYPRGGEFTLFGIQAIDPDDQQLYVTEGELDAMAMYDYGFAAVSVPYGAKGIGADGQNPNDPWIQHDFDWLEQFVDIVLALDCDKPGAEATAAIAPRLGLHRCRILEFPGGRKDANQCLLEKVSYCDLATAIADAADMDPAELKRPSDFRRLVWEEFYPTNGEPPGDPLPWAMPFRLRPSEVTLWHGYTKHGKTVCLSYLLAWLAKHRHRRNCVASMEIHAAKTVQNMMRQALGAPKPEHEKEFDAALSWMDRWTLIYDCLGEADPDTLFGCFSYAARKYGVSHFVIDSLMKIAMDEEDNKLMKEFMNRVCKFAQEHQVHVHLVAHDKKPDSRHPEEKYWPTKYQIRGTAHLADLSHNVVCVWRNKNKEATIKEAEATKDAQEAAMVRQDQEKVHDAMLAVQAQRGGDGDEPEKRLWFDAHGSWQYSDDPDHMTPEVLINS